MLLALLVAVPSTLFVSPFAAKGVSAEWAGVAVAENITDVVVQANQDNFLTLKQLDAVLRRRDLRLNDAAVPLQALEVARALGASDLIVGDLEQNGETFTLKARRVTVADGRTVATAEAIGTLADATAKIANQLLHAEGKPLTNSPKALEHAARCEIALARQSLGAHSKMTLPKDKLADAQRNCRAAVKLDAKLGLAHAGLAVTLAAQNKFDAARKEAQVAQKE